MYVIVGMHKILPEFLEVYLENMERHAQNSRSEPGCLRYEVLQDQDDPTLMCLNEVFEDETAFHAHQAADHYKWWMDTSREWRDGGPRLRHVMDFVAWEPGPSA